MDVVPTAERMTAREYLRIPWDGVRSELIEGELVVTEAGLQHQRVALRLVLGLRAWTEQAPGRGEVTLPIDVLIDDHNVYGPDALWYSAGRLDAAAHPYDVPDLAVEVRSPATWRHDIGTKKSGYERAGLPELWLVDTAAAVVLVFRRSSRGVPTFDVALEFGRDDELTSPQLPGFALAVATLFGD